MECSEFRERVHDLIDLEVTSEERALLEQKRAGCPCCQETHREALRLKQLVECRLPRPQMPGELRARLSRELLRRRRRLPLPVRVAAAAAVLLIPALVLFIAYGLRTPISHAQAARGAAEDYRGLVAALPLATPGGSQGDWRLEVAGSYRWITRAMLDALPDTSKLRFFGHAPYRVGRASGVRLGFFVPPADGPDEADAVVVCLYLLASGDVDLASEPEKVAEEMRGGIGHECRCFEVAPETVLCLCRGHVIVNVVSSLDSTHLRDALCLRL